MCSTEPGVYGTPDPQLPDGRSGPKGTEVPRDPLMSHLGERCTLVRSDAIEITTSERTIPAVKGSPKELPTPKSGKFTKGNLFVEYEF